jgi:hypothetical protein
VNERVIKLFFDANLSRVLVSELLAFYQNDYPNLQIKHLTEFTRADAQDPDWVRMLASESTEWVVITADRGINSRRSQKLPLICRQYDIRHILFTGTLLTRGTLHHKQAIVSVWLDIIDFCRTAPGSCAKLGAQAGSDSTRAYFRIVTSGA